MCSSDSLNGKVHSWMNFVAQSQRNQLRCCTTTKPREPIWNWSVREAPTHPNFGSFRRVAADQTTSGLSSFLHENQQQFSTRPRLSFLHQLRECSAHLFSSTRKLVLAIVGNPLHKSSISSAFFVDGFMSWIGSDACWRSTKLWTNVDWPTWSSIIDRPVFFVRLFGSFAAPFYHFFGIRPVALECSSVRRATDRFVCIQCGRPSTASAIFRRSWITASVACSIDVLCDQCFIVSFAVFFLF